MCSVLHGHISVVICAVVLLHVAASNPLDPFSNSWCNGGHGCGEGFCIALAGYGLDDLWEGGDDREVCEIRSELFFFLTVAVPGLENRTLGEEQTLLLMGTGGLEPDGCPFFASLLLCSLLPLVVFCFCCSLCLFVTVFWFGLLYICNQE